MKKNINRILFICALTGALAFASYAAPAPYSVFGDAMLVSPGNNSPTAAQLVSDASPGYGGVDFNITPGLTFGDLDTLSADFKMTAGDCAGGSPRFQINVVDPNSNQTKNIFVYVGPYPNYTGCQPNTWATTGDLLEAGNYVDATQVGGGFYNSYTSALTSFGSYEVTGIQLVVDGGWAFSSGIQTAVVDNVMINGTTFTFESANSCKNGGWQSFSTAPGPFTNQGQCVSYFARGGQ